MTAFNFTEADSDNLALVRQIVLRRLRDDHEWTQWDYAWEPRRVDRFVTFEIPRLRSRFVDLAREIMWQLIIQGVITPGMNTSNPNLPFFRITSYGDQVLKAERFVPHDPAGYLDDVRAVTATEIGQASLGYLEEALRCFTSGCHLASVLLLGIAAEAVFVRLCDEITPHIRSTAEQNKFEKLEWMKQKHRWLADKLSSIPAASRKSDLTESLDVSLTSLSDLIRRQRNELGHPQDTLPEIGRDLAFTYFKLFPTFVSDAETFSAYAKKHGL